MEKNPTTAEDLKTIRKIMEESTKFLSLSGFSGVLLGSFAITGAIAAYYFVLGKANIKFINYVSGIITEETKIITLQLLIVASAVLILSLISAFYLSMRKAKRSGKKFLTPVSKRLLVNLFIPLVAGGCFILILLFHGQIKLVIPGLLVFYGLALVNAGKFTYDEIFYLGNTEIAIGIIAAFLPAQGLLFWIVGFGILHIAYGIFMYRKYEV